MTQRTRVSTNIEESLSQFPLTMQELQKFNTKCRICPDKQRCKNVYLSNCQHQGYCIQCVSNYIKKKLQDNIFPTCIQCKERMILHPQNQPQQKKYFINYLPIGLKQQLHKFQKSQTIKLLKQQPKPCKPCKIPDCKGYIQGNKCSKCNKSYCEKCGDLDHPFIPLLPCPTNSDPLKISNLKQCPNCKQGFIKVEGCLHMKCGYKQCQHQFCYVCYKPWKLTHHACALKLSKIQQKCSFLCF